MFFKKKKEENTKKARERIDEISREISEIWTGEENAKQFDANGSYTGNPEGFEVPVQDADDL